MIERRIEQFQSGAFTLTGQWDGPDGAEGGQGRLPGVIFCHGFTGNRMESRRMYAQLSRRLAESGVLTFRFDHRGCGESEGDFRDFDADGLLEDLDCALKVFLDNGRLDVGRTAVVGYSLGGLSASYLLAQRPDFLTAVQWAAVARPDIIRERLATYPDFNSYTARGYFNYMGWRVSAGYIDGIGRLSPMDWAAGFRKPVLFIHGAEDGVVKPSQVELYLAGRQFEGDQLLMIENGDHFFGTPDNIDRVLSTSESWLLKHLRP